MKTVPRFQWLSPFFLTGAMAIALVACGGGGQAGSGTGGSGAGGVSATGGASATGGERGTGGRSESGGASGTGGASATGGSATGGMPAQSGGASGSTGGSGGAGASGSGGATTGGSGGATTGGRGGGPTGGRGGAATGGGGAAGGPGSSDGGISDGGGADATDAGNPSFAPCPTNGDPCKILPLGDSITLGTNYQGGYRIKLYAHAVTDKKNITFVGYDTANPPAAATLSALGTAGAAFVNKHEGHYAWTIQQDDDVVTGVSTGSQDGVNYSGKKVVADAHPHIILVHLGTNDMQVQPSGASDRLAKLIDHVVADAPDALVVVASIIPLPAQASTVNSFNQAIPGIVSARAAAGKHVIYVDQFAGFNGKTGLMDSVHPYEAGYEQMAVVWYAAIKAYLY